MDSFLDKSTLMVRKRKKEKKKKEKKKREIYLLFLITATVKMINGNEIWQAESSQ